VYDRQTLIWVVINQPNLEPEVDAIVASFCFGGPPPSPSPSVTSTPAPDCRATIHYDRNIQPDQVLSAWATYVDVETGQEVVPISEAFFIGGQPTGALPWKGTETTIEVQYTCPGGQAHYDIITVPAFGQPTPTETATPEHTTTPAAPDMPVPEVVSPEEEAQPDPGTPTLVPTPTSTPTITLTPTGKAGGLNRNKAIGAAAVVAGLGLAGAAVAGAGIVIAKTLSGKGAAAAKPAPPPPAAPAQPAPPPAPPEPPAELPLN